LPAAVVPVLVGTATAVAAGQFRWLSFLAAMATALLLQVSTNLANDYFDFRKGADTPDRLGPVRVTQSGLLSPETVRIATLFSFSLTALVGLYLVSVGGWPILVLGLLSMAAGALYTGGPWPLGYHGFGDLLVFIFFGMVAVVGTFYLHTDTVTTASLVNAVPVGLMVTAILVVNNLRDRVTDRAAGKYTLAVRLGPQATRAQYVSLIAGAYIITLLRWLAGAASLWFWLPCLSLPLAFAMVRLVLREEGRPLNAALKGTAQLHLLFGSLFAVSLML
jgi:1,4-dihydroxy-2-naphthoate octaprenyltransferase